MRLKPEQKQFIKSTIARHFGEGARVWLFGSRVDDAKRGGDVDLYIETESDAPLYERRLRCLTDLEMGLPYPVDLVVAATGSDRPIDRIALRNGVLL